MRMRKAIEAIEKLDYETLSSGSKLASEILITLYFSTINVMPEECREDATASFCAELEDIKKGSFMPYIRGFHDLKYRPYIQPFAGRMEQAMDELPGTTAATCHTKFCEKGYAAYKALSDEPHTEEERSAWFAYFCGRCPHMDERCTK